MTDNDVYQDFLNECCAQMPDCWDEDVAQEAIILDYIDHLQKEVRRLGGTLHRWDHDPDGYVCG